MIGKAIESAQIKVEGFFFDQRKRLVEFDDVMNKQREIIYKRRRRLLEQSADGTVQSTKNEKENNEESENLRDLIMKYIQDEVQTSVSLRAPDQFTEDEMDAIVKEFIKIIPFDDHSQAELRTKLANEAKTTGELVDRLMEIVLQTYEQRENAIGMDSMRQLERYVVLSTIDQMWMDHLDEMQSLRDGIWLRGDKQTVLGEYKKEAFAMFESLIQRIESEVAKRIFRVNIAQPRSSIPTVTIQQKDETDPLDNLEKTSQKKALPTSTTGSLSDLAQAMQGATATKRPEPGSAVMKIGRNDLCPCGSGKKWKKCGMVNAPWHKG